MLLGQLACHSKVSVSLSGTSLACSLALLGPGDRHQYEKSNFEPASMAQYLGVMIDSIRERIYPVDFNYQIPGYGECVSSPVYPLKDVTVRL